jgi:O-antigen/teichoic acid export membrane protein
MARSSPLTRLTALISTQRKLLRDYFSAISGSAGRLVFSLVYFVALANTLSIADFGLFATASAAGVLLSRILSFGFISALYRTATIRPRLIGTFTAGFLLLAALSLPLLILASLLVHRLFFSHELALFVFASIVFAEALLWRPMEVVLIVNNGLGRFGRAATMTILGSVIRASAAMLFVFSPTRTLEIWAEFYIGANALCLIVALMFFYPRQRLRLRTPLYWRRMMDSIYVAGAEILFYLQMEFDKLLVLAIGGPHLAGIYAIIMRLVDLTAIPIRTFSMMLVQRMMRAPQLLEKFKIKAMIEGGIFLVSSTAFLTLAVILHFFPTLLGENVSQAAPLLMLALLVPGLRNLVEYQAELLFARGQTLLRAGNLAFLAAMKGALLSILLYRGLDEAGLIMALNWMFVILYVESALLTYWALLRPAKPI